MQSRPLVVFDTETIPDPALHTGDEFPKTPFHQVVAISFLAARVESTEGGPQYVVDELRTGGDVTYSEGQLVKAFFQYVEKKRPRLVTFNGRGFDLPMLKYRGLKHEGAAPWFAKGEGRWDNYGYRYNVDWHCDLMDVLSDYGASKAASLSDVSALLGVPCKLGIEGPQVKGLVEAGRLAEVRDYCETDVLSTYLIFLRLALFRGEMSARGHANSTADLQAYLAKERSARPHLGVFLDAWTALQAENTPTVPQA